MSRVIKLNPRNPLVVVLALVVTFVALATSLVFGSAMLVLSWVLHPVLIKMGRRGMWRDKPNGGLMLCLDREAFQKVGA